MEGRSVDTTPCRSHDDAPSVDHDAFTEPSAWLGRYEVLFSLGAGGMAEVFAGRLTGEGGFQKAVAIKVMLPHLARNQRFVEMFLDEGRIASSIASPHVVETLEMGRDEQSNALYIVMELVVGQGLNVLLQHAAEQQTPLPLPVALSIAVQAASGLSDVHAATTPTGERLDIIHRDISPHNILIGADGRARLTDFGVAHALERVTRTATGEWKGKAQYTSPEQVMRAPLDQRVDVFALGLVTWELCTGKRLFEGDHPLVVAQEIRRKRIPRLDEVADVPTPIADVVAESLARDRNRRTPDAHTFHQALVDAAESTVGLATEEEVGVFVEDLASAEIAQLRRSLRNAMSSHPPPMPSGEREVDARPRSETTRTWFAKPRRKVGTASSPSQVTLPAPAYAPVRLWRMVALSVLAGMVSAVMVSLLTRGFEGGRLHGFPGVTAAPQARTPLTRPGDDGVPNLVSVQPENASASRERLPASGTPPQSRAGDASSSWADRAEPSERAASPPEVEASEPTGNRALSPKSAASISSPSELPISPMPEMLPPSVHDSLRELGPATPPPNPHWRVRSTDLKDPWSRRHPKPEEPPAPNTHNP